MGLFCLALGVTASSLNSRQHEFVMREGEAIQWAGRRVRLRQIVQRELPDKLVAEARLDLLVDSIPVATVTPAKHFHRLQGEWTSEVGIHSSWRGDFYTILQNGEGPGQVRLTFVENPMIGWIWFGGWMMAIGSCVGLWPARRASAVKLAPRRKHDPYLRRPPSAALENLCH
jgi:cytochrome c-type biogenesis protein CcmF